MLKSAVEIILVVLLWGAGLALLYGLVILYESVMAARQEVAWETEEMGMWRKKKDETKGEMVPASSGQEIALSGALDVARQVGDGQNAGFLDGLAAVFAARHEAGLEEKMLVQAERKLAVRQRLAEGVGKTYDAEDGAKDSIHKNAMNDIRRRRELEAALNPPAPAPPAALTVTALPTANATPAFRAPAPTDAEMKRIANQACVVICQSANPEAAWEAWKRDQASGSGYAASVRAELEELVQARLQAMDVL